MAATPSERAIARPKPLTANASINMTPMIDAAKGAGVERVGIVTASMRRQ